MTQLDIRTVHHPGRTVVSVTGELDVLSRTELERLLDRLREDGHRRVVVDVTELTFCDISGLRLMLLSTRRFFDAGGWFRLRGLSRTVSRLADLMQVRRQAVADASCTYALACEDADAPRDLAR